MAWFEDLPDTLTIDQSDGTKLPIRDHQFLKESPDVGHFALKAMAQHKELGSRLPVRKAETPEAAEQWRKENLPKLWDAGLLEKPPATPEEYEIRKPAELARGQVWSDEHALKLAGLMQKYNMPKRAAQEFLALHSEVLGLGQKSLKTSYDEGMTALKREFGDRFDARMEQVKRFAPSIFKTPEEIEFFSETGIGDHPLFLSVMARLAPMIEQDNSVITDANRGAQGSVTPDQVKAELADIMSNKNNPKYTLYWQKDPATQDYINELYRKAYGSGKVQL